MKRRKKNKRQGRAGTEGYPLEGTVKGMAPTEAVFLEVKDYLADFNYEMSDGTWKHLEFESDSISEEDLRRFRAYSDNLRIGFINSLG